MNQLKAQPVPDLSVTPRAMWRLAWPQMLMMYLLFFNGIVTIWAAGQINRDVQASLGLVTQCGMFLMVVIIAISSGATASISQSLGMGKMLRAKLYIFTTVAGSLLLGIIMAIPAYVFGDPILKLIQTPQEIMPISRQAWDIAVFGFPFQYVYLATGVLFRATRMVFPPLFVSAIILTANFAGSLGFGLGYGGLPAYGYAGLMWTNVATQSLGAIINCILLWRTGYLQFRHLPTFHWLGMALPYLLKVAIPAGAASIVWQSGYLTLFMLVASLPVDNVSAVAGLTAGLRAEGFLFMPSMAFNMTCSVMVGNSLGQNRPEQAKRVGLQLTAIAAGLMSGVAVFVWPFRAEIAAFLSTDPETQAQIIDYLFWNLLGTPFSIASQVMGGIMVGAGATRYNLIIYGGTFWAARIPLGWLLGHMLWRSANGVFAAMFISQAVQASLMLYVVLRKNWQRFAMSSHLARQKS